MQQQLWVRTTSWLDGHKFLLWMIVLYLLVALGLFLVGQSPSPSAPSQMFPGSD